MSFAKPTLTRARPDLRWWWVEKHQSSVSRPSASCKPASTGAQDHLTLVFPSRNQRPKGNAAKMVNITEKIKECVAPLKDLMPSLTPR